MADHTEFLQMALEMIAEEGRKVTLLGISTDPANPDKPWKGSANPRVVIGEPMAVALPFRGFEFGSLYEQSDNFKECAEILLIAGGQGNFESCQFVRDEGKEYTVAWVQRLRPANMTILYAIGIDR